MEERLNQAEMEVYVHSLCFVLAKAVHDLYPSGRLYIEHALSRGYYCEIEIGRELNHNDLIAIKRQMQAIIDADYPFVEHEDATNKVIELFRGNDRDDKALLLETSGETVSKYYTLNEYVDSFYSRLLPSTKSVYLFDIELYNHTGLLLRIPNKNRPSELEPYVNQAKLSLVFREWLQLQKALNLSNVGELNQKIQAAEIAEVVQLAEVLQERKIGKIADEIALKFDSGVRIVLIAGPSSSGKTTFCKRLQTQLSANLLHPIAISLDDYYINREDTPLDENGEYDYESLYTIDLELFNADLKKILNGEDVALPTYNFQLGRRLYKGNTIRLDERSVLIMEGIHGLNPRLIPEISSEQVYKVYVSALTSISLDNHNWISSSDNRLIRRMVRDHQFRGYSAKGTIARWSSVRAGEDLWIFPYQENADVLFNSAMVYELAALRKIAEPVLQEIVPEDAESAEAQRLLKLLQHFNPIDTKLLPSTSLLREFVGGSSFRY
ncbi:uridine kinase [Bacteroidia bacterium]|nr:uridine kinase [Bacteroidia bacterium]